MAKIPRKTQKIFAGSATNNGQFGSAQLGAKVLSQDLDVLQGLSAFPNGWLDAVLSGLQLPPLEEDQALHYIETTQIAYMLQEGIAEYDAATTYFIKSIVKKVGTYQIYGSLTDNNVGNALTDAGNWTLLQDLSAPASGAISYVWGGSAGGSANALTLTPSPAISSYTTGQPFGFLPTANNTNAATVNISGQGLVALKKDGTTALAPNDLVAGRLTFGIHDGTNIQILNPPTWSHGADVASASTMVLDGTGGEILNISGANTINAVTLLEGRLKVCKFAGACQLTYSSTLLLNTGSANYITAANDVVVFYGLAGGVVVGLITPASGLSPAAATTYSANTFLANATTGAGVPTGIALAASTLAGRGSSGNIAQITLDSTLAIVGTVLGLASAGTIKAVQYFSSSGTYTKTTGANKALVFAQAGGGGGGAPGAADGTSGGNTTISTLTANGGVRGANVSTGANGGTATGGDVNLTGTSGGQGAINASSGTVHNAAGGIGGIARLFGGISLEAGQVGDTLGTQGAPATLPVNSGSGGSGKANTSISGQGGYGGGAGGLAIKLFDAGTLTGATVTIGALGTAGAGGYAGSSGYVLIIEFA